MKSGILTRTLAVCGIFSGMLLAGSPAQAANVRELLRRSVTVDRRLSYQGTKVLSKWYGRTEVTSTVKTYHVAPDRTRMVGVDGELAGASVLQIGRQHFIRPAGGAYRVNPMPLPEDNTELLFRNYRIKEQRQEQIAGRKCVMVYIEPRYKGNPSKRVWLDVNTALPLKTIVYNQDGEPTEGSIFVRIQYNPRIPMIYAPAQARRANWPEVKPDFRMIRVRKSGLPAGYELVETSVRKLGRYIVSFQRFTDGLNTLTLLASRTHPDLPTLGGHVAASGQVGSVKWVLCGEHEARAIERIRDSCH